MFIYDVSKDSDGGAWTEKCQHTSWYNETIYGKWLGAQRSELFARCVNPTLGPELVDTANIASSWNKYGNNTVEQDSSAVKVTYVDNSSGAYIYINAGGGVTENLVDTKTYQVTFDVKVNSGATVSLEWWARGAGAVLSDPISSTDYVTVTWYTNTANAAAFIRVAGMGVGEIAWVRNISVKEVISQTTATNDYYQLTNGLFYALNAGSGVTEVFRGNKRSFPKLAAIVCQSSGSGQSQLVVYDLTEPNLPMWMVFADAAVRPRLLNWAQQDSGFTHAAIMNGWMVGVSNTNQGSVNFIHDKLTGHTNYRFRNSLVANRNDLGAAYVSSGEPTLFYTAQTNSARNVEMYLDSDAVFDPISRMPVPTVVIGSVKPSIMNSNKSAAAYQSSYNYTDTIRAGTILGSIRGFNAFSPSFYYTLNPGLPNASSGELSTSTYPDFAAGGSAVNLIGHDNGRFIKSAGTTVQHLVANQKDMSKGLSTKLSDTYNTGWLAGDIRRAYLASNFAGIIGPTTELVTNGTFDSDTTGWTPDAGITLEQQSGEMYVSGGQYSGVTQSFTVVPGKQYILWRYVRGGSGTLRFRTLINGVDYGGIQFIDNGLSEYRSFIFVASGTTASIKFQSWNTPASFYLDNISVKEIIPDRSYKAAASTINGTLTATAVNTGNDLVAYSGFSATDYLQEPYSADLDFGTGEWSCSAWVNVPTANSYPGIIMSRAASSGPFITMGVNSANNMYATVYDGTTTRTANTSLSYNSGKWVKIETNYKAGKLAILMNGTEVSSNTGSPLTTLNNANATLTIGNSYALDAPFPGSIALLKLSATVPTNEQSLFMYEQEKQLFTANAKCVLPSSTSVLDLSYDDKTDTWITTQASQESTWSGLIRTSNTAPPAGSFSRSTAASGIELSAITTTNPGVYISSSNNNIVSYNTISKNKNIITFNYDTIGFTANTVSGNTYLTNVTVITGTPYVGMKITGTGIPINTVITGINSNTYYISNAATVTSANVTALYQTDYTLPVNYSAIDVYVNGDLKEEGATKNYIKAYDGFRETISFGISPGSNSWVQIYAAQE